MINSCRLLMPKFTIWEDACFVWRMMSIVGKLFFLNVFNKRLCIDFPFCLCCLITIYREFICLHIFSFFFFLSVLLQLSFCKQFHWNNTRKFSQSEEPKRIVSGIIIWKYIPFCKFIIF